MARWVLQKRDHGICAQCGLDCKRIEKWIRSLWRRGWVYRVKRRLGIPRHRQTCWDMDHILPVKEGGGMCGLDNLQTLCWRCHAAKTFAKKPSEQRELALF